MVEPVAHRRLHQPRGIAAGQPLLGLALELRIPHEGGQLARHAAGHVLRGDLRRPPVAPLLSPGAHALEQRGAEPGLVRAAQRGRHGVAVGMQEAVRALQPGHRPLRPSARAAVVAHRQGGLAGPDRRDRHRRAGHILRQAVAQAAREVQHCLRRDVGAPLEQRRVARPADGDAAEQVGLGPAKPVQPGRLELQPAEYLRVRLEPDGGAPPVLDRPGVHQLAGRLPPRVALPPQRAVTGDLHLERLAQRVDHRAADPVQPARGGVGVPTELAAGVQRGEDDLEGAQLLELGMRVDGDAAPVVPHGKPVAGLQRHVDGGGVAGDRLVHRVVEDFRGQVVERVLVRAADIHAGTAPHRLQPLEDLDVLGRIGRFVPPDLGGAEQIVHVVFP